MSDEIEEGRALFKSRVTPEIYALGHLRARAGRRDAEVQGARQVAHLVGAATRPPRGRRGREGAGRGSTCSWRGEVAGGLALAARAPDRAGRRDGQRRRRAAVAQAARGRRRRLDAAAGRADASCAPRTSRSTVVHEDRWLVVIDKPAGPGRAPGARARGGHAGERAARPLRRPARHRRRAASRHRPPHRQGHLGAAGRRQGRRDDERAGRRRSRRTTSSASTRRSSSASRRAGAGASTRCTGAIRTTARSSRAA